MKILIRSVMIRQRDLSDVAKQAHSTGVKLCKGAKTQKFTQVEAVTASYGNITVCAPDARSARMALKEQLETRKHRMAEPKNILEMMRHLSR